MIDALRRYRGVLHYAAGPYPALFYPLFALRRGPGDGNPVTRATEVVVEGFPRCGNTFALHALCAAQAREPVTADHVHVPAQVVRAHRRGLPMLVVVREPEAAVRSLVVKYPFVRPADALRGYLGFYRRAWRCRDGFVVADFAQTTTDFGAVVDRLNARFGTRFARFEHTEANVARVFERIGVRGRSLGQNALQAAQPHESKAAAKASVDLAGCEGLLARCQEMHRRYLELAGS